MQSATRLDDLKILECFLQNSLHAHLGRIIPFRVQCLYKDDTLWVLAQHPADVVIHIPEIFSVLERSLQGEEPKTPLAVKLYLRTEGNQRPYSQESFTVYPIVQKSVPGEAAPEMTGMSEDRIALEREPIEMMPGEPLEIPEHQVDNSHQISSTGSEIVLQPDRQDLSEDKKPSQNRLIKVDADAFVADIEHSFGTVGEPKDRSASSPAGKRKQILFPILGGLGLLAVGAGAGYMGTRPCVLQACTELTTANSLTKASLDTLSNPSVTGQEVLIAQKQLHQSVTNLKSIPGWSGSYSSAQKSLQATEPQINDLDTTVGAMNKAFKAANIVKNPPIPTFQWQESRRMWTESIASLRKIPATSKIYPLAQQKLTDYQARLADIERRINIEMTAEENLKSAIGGIKAASQSQSTAQSLSEWRVVKSQWDRIDTQLSNIPATTGVYAQAQELLKSYRSQFAIAQDKVLEEDKATKNYKTAIELAQAAKLSQKNNQLAQAVAQWNQAVVLIQGIPQNSAIYPQAKPLVIEYTKSFQQAESQFKTTQRIAQATKDLQRTCAGNPQICSYTITNKGIVVRLMSLYTQTLKQTAIAASNQGDLNAKSGILAHVNTLGNALQTISQNAKLPLEVYGADGKQIQNYRP